MAVPRALARTILGLLAPWPATQAQPLVRPPTQAADAGPGAWPVSAVGKLNVITGPASRRHCTATLIGPRLVLKAAHCLFIEARQRWVEPADVHFVAGYAQGAYTAHALARYYSKPDA